MMGNFTIYTIPEPSQELALLGDQTRNEKFLLNESIKKFRNLSKGEEN